MRDAHGGVSGVHALTARPGRTVDVDLEVVRIDLDLDLLCLRHHGDRGGRGVHASLRLCLGHTLDPAGPALPLEDRVRALAFDSERDLLVAAGLVRARADRIDLEAAPLRVTG